MPDIIMIFIAFLLVLLNAFFVAAEFGIVKLRQTQIQVLEELYGFRGQILAEIHKQLDSYLSACQLGITLASLGLGWIGEPAVANVMEPIFVWLGIESPHLIKVISFVTAFTLLSFIHIVVGELMPKSLAIRQPESISLWTAIPLYAFFWIFYPAIWLLNACSNHMLRIAKLDKVQHGEHYYSTDEIKLILTSSHLHGELSEDETGIIEHALDLAELEVTEVMRPRDELVALDISHSIPRLMKTIIQHQYSRYPVYKRNKHNIIGILHSKDLFKTLYLEKEIKDLKPMIRPILTVPHQLPAMNLLRKFRAGIHFAIVYKDKKTPIGFVTLDNLLHVLLGRIKDEFHKTKVDWVKNSDGTYTVGGDCSIYSLERALDLDIELEDDSINTITGLIFQKLGAFPKEGDRIEFEDFDVVIEKIDGAKIESVRIILK